MHSLQERVGELFISGFRGNTPSADLLNQLEKRSLGGIVLFAENCADHENVRASIKLLQAHSPKRLFIAIDQEGGRVCRLLGKPAEYDSAESYGQSIAEPGSALEAALARYRTDFEMAAEYISGLGINFLLGPVCDLRPDDEPQDGILNKAHNETRKGPQSPPTALSGRTFGAAPDVVSAFVRQTVETAHDNNLLCCLKHAPGLGSVKADPHIALGASQQSAAEFSQRDMAPFRAGYESGADSVMTSHFLIPELDSVPVTFSRTIIESLIRKHISNETPLITDDLDMGALCNFGGVGAVCIRALNAGHDLLLARSNDTVTQGIAALRAGLVDGTVHKDRFVEALRRVETLRESLETIS